LEELAQNGTAVGSQSFQDALHIGVSRPHQMQAFDGSPQLD